MPLGIISLELWNLYLRASFSHPRFPLPPARLISVGASANNLLNVSFVVPESTPSGLPAGLEPDAPHPHSCLDCALCGGWVIPWEKESDVSSFTWILLSIDTLWKIQRELISSPLHNCAIAEDRTQCGSSGGEPPWGTLAYRSPRGSSRNAEEANLATYLAISSEVEGCQRGTVWGSFPDISFHYWTSQSFPLLRKAPDSNPFYLSANSNLLFGWGMRKTWVLSLFF